MLFAGVGSMIGEPTSLISVRLRSRRTRMGVLVHRHNGVVRFIKFVIWACKGPVPKYLFETPSFLVVWEKLVGDIGNTKKNTKTPCPAGWTAAPSFQTVFKKNRNGDSRDAQHHGPNLHNGRYRPNRNAKFSTTKFHPSRC
jgi:hypothetical protein